MADQVPADVVAERYERLVAVVEDGAWSEAKTCVGGPRSRCWSRRVKDGKTLLLDGFQGVRATIGWCIVARCEARPGDVVRAVVSHAAPHHLVADEVIDIRRSARWRCLAGEARDAGLDRGVARYARPI